jgi:ABC-type transport system involved in multi-copper enzyme maturation permease subunit
MTARSIPSTAGAAGERRVALFLGFGTAFRKELTEWLRGPKTLVIAAVSISVAIFTTLITLITQATTDLGEVVELSTDPTTNVLYGWSGEVVGLIAVVATMALVSAERDRGTLAWSLANPVSPTSILAAKFAAAVLVISTAAVIVPMAISVGVATIAYGGVADLATVTLFTVLFLALPTFYVGLSLALGAGLKSTVGVASVALAVLFVPDLLGRLVPVIAEWSPTSIATWTQAVVAGQPAPLSPLIAWGASMVLMVVGAKVVFDRQEF